MSACLLSPPVQTPLVADVDYELKVSERGDTLWVNAVDGSSIGRFSKKFGIDVHRTITAQMAGSDQCLFCTHVPAGSDDWVRFRAAMKAQYGIELAPDLLQF